MPYQLSDDEALVAKVAREFARDRIGLEAAADLDRHDRFPSDNLTAAAQLGLTTMGLPENLGGAGVGGTAFALALDEIAQVCPNTATILATHTMGLRALSHAPDLLARIIPGVASGQVLAVLVSEEAYGSDVRTVGTRASAGPSGGFLLTGQKVWGLAAAGASHFLVLANVPATKPSDPKGPTLFLVPRDAPGVSLGQNEPLLGLRASGIRTVYLAGVPVGVDAVVGPVGSALAILDEARAWLKVGAAAVTCGCVAGAFEAAARFAESRVQFGNAIGMYQAVSDSVTEIDVQLAAARALTREAAALLGDAAGTPEAPPAAAGNGAGSADSGNVAVAAARAKLWAAQMAVEMTRKAIRVQGGTGFMREGGSERFARDARALQFVGETVHMQRDVLKRAALSLPFAQAP